MNTHKFVDFVFSVCCIHTDATHPLPPELTRLGEHDLSLSRGEFSGIVDGQSVLGPGWFLFDDQVSLSVCWRLMDATFGWWMNVWMDDGRVGFFR